MLESSRVVKRAGGDVRRSLRTPSGEVSELPVIPSAASASALASLVLLSEELFVRLLLVPLVLISSPSSSSSILLRVAFPLDAPRAFADGVPRLGHLVHLSRRAAFPSLGRLIRVPLERRLLVRLLYEFASALLRELVQIFREVEHLGVIAIVLVRVFIALRLAIRRHHLLRQSPSLGRPALRDGLDDLQRGSKVGEGALRVRIPRVRLGARGEHPRARLRIRRGARGAPVGTAIGTSIGTFIGTFIGTTSERSSITSLPT